MHFFQALRRASFGRIAIFGMVFIASLGRKERALGELRGFDEVILMKRDALRSKSCAERGLRRREVIGCDIFDSAVWVEYLVVGEGCR